MLKSKDLVSIIKQQHNAAYFQLNYRYLANSNNGISHQRRGIFALIIRYWKTELLIAFIALVVAALQYLGEERRFKNEQKLQKLQIFNDTVTKIVETKNTSSTATANNVALLAHRADEIIKQYPHDISPSDLLTIYSYTNLGFDPERGLRWLNMAYLKSEEQNPKNLYDQILSRWYLGAWYFYNSKDLKKAEIFFNDALSKIDREKSPRYKNLYLQIEFERASAYRDLGYFDKCIKKIDDLFEYIRQYPNYVDATSFNNSIKSSNQCYKYSITFKKPNIKMNFENKN